MAPESRRGFLSGLVRLPLIGGGVSLIGRPTATAEPITPVLLEAYKTWLEYERSSLAWDMAKDPVHRARYRFSPDAEVYDTFRHIDRAFAFIGDSNTNHDDPASRAALVLSAVGCDWRRDS